MTFTGDLPGLGEAPPRCGIHNMQIYLSLDKGGWLCQACESGSPNQSEWNMANPVLFESARRMTNQPCESGVADRPGAQDWDTELTEEPTQRRLASE